MMIDLVFELPPSFALTTMQFTTKFTRNRFQVHTFVEPTPDAFTKLKNKTGTEFNSEEKNCASMNL